MLTRVYEITGIETTAVNVPASILVTVTGNAEFADYEMYWTELVETELKKHGIEALNYSGNLLRETGK
jgi:hypothetical protein